jgi:hypothetical protein
LSPVEAIPCEKVPSRAVVNPFRLKHESDLRDSLGDRGLGEFN